jgi:GT2 family glycosyltransferase
VKTSLFSLLIATLNRTEPLRRLFESLAQQTCRDFKILIADQNPPGFLDSLRAEFQNILPLHIVPVPDKGVSHARNALLPHVRGALIAFPDDDCWYRPDTLEQAAAFFAANPHVHALLGQWHDPAGSIRPQQRFGHIVTRFSVFRRGETFVQFYRKAVVDAVGGFDPELGPGTDLPYGCGEDTDYLLRALAAGFTVVSAPGIQVCHPDTSRSPPAVEKIRSYAFGRMHLLHKHSFPLWFKLAIVIYPLLRIPFESRQAWAYRKTMFLGRLAGLFTSGMELPSHQPPQDL